MMITKMILILDHHCDQYYAFNHESEVLIIVI